MPRTGTLGTIERWILRVSERKLLIIVLIGAVALAGRALLMPVLPVPKPAIQDEFSYLLAADTFASGRLANPTPPLAEHFETLEELIRPTYSSKYPPFSGLVMALAQKLTGEPWIGVWFSTGVLCSAICWALQGWLPPVWALVGSVVALLRIGVVSYWNESYWGGTCAAIGGALLIGAVPRLAERPRTRTAIAFAAGLAILANTRPYEGLLLAIACLGYLALAKQGGLRRPAIILPMLVVLASAGAWMAYYNYRVTGNPLELPYLAHEKQYAVWSPWLWQTHPRPEPHYSNALLHDFWTIGDDEEKRYAHDHLLKAHVSDLWRLGRFFLGGILGLCLIATARPLWRDQTARRALLSLAAFYAGCAIYTRLFPHYAAPATALAYVLAACALRAVRKAWPGSPFERMYVTWSIFVLFALTTLTGLLAPENRYMVGPVDYHVKAKRARVAERLRQESGRHLVLVRYGPNHDLYEELVYNAANIERSEIVWARSLGADKDRELIGRFAGRKVWLLEEDGEVTLRQYENVTNSTITSDLRGRNTRRF